MVIERISILVTEVLWLSANDDGQRQDRDNISSHFIVLLNEGMVQLHQTSLNKYDNTAPQERYFEIGTQINSYSQGRHCENYSKGFTPFKLQVKV